MSPSPSKPDLALWTCRRAIGSILWLSLAGCGGDGTPAPGSSTYERLDPGSAEVSSGATPFLESDNGQIRVETADALEMAAAAPGTYPVHLTIYAAQRARDEIQARVERHEGYVLDMSSQGVFVEIPAEQLSVVFCWPGVDRVEISTPYWDAVDPPWGRASVGTSQCPIVDGACPPHCAPVEGQRLDTTRNCLLPSENVACDFRFLDVTADDKCRADTATGDFFRFGGLGPAEPGFRNFRACSDDEYQTVTLAPACQR